MRDEQKMFFGNSSQEGSSQLFFHCQHVCDKCQRVHFTWKLQQQFDVYCTENSWRDPADSSVLISCKHTFKVK
jgi:hypothetical protein